MTISVIADNKEVVQLKKRAKEDEVLVTKKLKKDKAGEEDLAKKSNLKEEKESVKFKKRVKDDEQEGLAK